MAECVTENEGSVKLDGSTKIEAFDLAINMSDKFEILGLDKTETKFVLKDVTLSDGEHGRYIEIDVQEVVDKPLDDIINVIENGRNDIVVKGYTRIVGYYSGVQNWNSSKIGELRDRAKGTYGTPNFVPENQKERLDYINNH
jgi:DNA-binding cell septation regulator SpoVG